MPGSSPGMTPSFPLARRFTDSIFKQPGLANAPPPLLVWSARGIAAFQTARSRKRTEGARDAAGPKRTRRLRCLATPKRIKQPRFTLSRSTRAPQVRQSQGVPRAVFIGLLRMAPGGLTFQAPCLTASVPIHRLRAQTMPSTSDRAGRRRQWGHVARGWRAGTHAAWTAGPPHRISDAKSFPGHRSPPRV